MCCHFDEFKLKFSSLVLCIMSRTEEKGYHMFSIVNILNWKSFNYTENEIWIFSLSAHVPPLEMVLVISPSAE